MSDQEQAYQPVRSRGVYVAGENDYPSNVGMVAHEQNSAPSGVYQTRRLTAASGNVGNGYRVALHVANTDHEGRPYTVDNPMPFYQVDSPGANEVVEGQRSVNVAPNTSVNHTFTPSGTFKLREVSVSSVLDAEFATSVGGTEKDFANCAPANPTQRMTFDPPITVPAGVVISVLKRNRSLIQQTDLKSSIKGFYASTP